MSRCRALAHFTAGGVRRLNAVAPVENLVSDVRREIELKARAIRLQGLVEVDRAGRLEERTHDASHLVIVVACQHRLAFEPPDLRPWRAHNAIRSSTVSGNARPPIFSAVRSSSGYSLRESSWCERMRR